MSTQECMSVSCHRNKCQRHMMFVHHATLGVDGFHKAPSLDDVDITNNYYNKDAINSTRSKRPKGSKSIHGDKDWDKSNKTGKQVFDNFDESKNLKMQELIELNLNSTELNERLRIAIDAMDFEMAAAIRDVQKM